MISGNLGSPLIFLCHTELSKGTHYLDIGDTFLKYVLAEGRLLPCPARHLPSKERNGVDSPLQRT